MSGKITSDVLESHLKCRYKGYLKIAGKQGLPHDYEILIKESRERIRQSAITKLLVRHECHEIPNGLSLTTGLLQRGLPLLLDATFENEDLSVCFDALLRVDGDSPLGSFHYQPVIFHEAEKATPDLRLLLGIHGVVLSGVQGKEPAVGILFLGRDCRERKVKMAGVAGQARRRLREAREATIGPPPRLVLNSHCQICEFRQRCQAEATAKNDISLLRSMAEAEVQKYARRGIFTVIQLSCTFRPPRRMKNHADRKVTHLHTLQALATREKKVYILGSPQLPDSLRRIYLDIEGDPEKGFCYLVGMIVRVGEVEQQRHSFWIDSPADEPKLLGQLLQVADLHPDAWIYTYGGYEATFLRRVGKVAGRMDQVGRVLARLCNVLSVVYTHVYFPVHCNGLKEIAGHLSFRWTDPNASGIQSIVWRRRWEESGLAALKEKLTTYNLEDCEALRRVTEFLHAACACPQAAAEQEAGVTGQKMTRVEEMDPVSSRRRWCRMDFAVADFEFINERAYFDYQRDRVYVRSSKTIKKSQARSRTRKGNRTPRANQNIEIRSKQCPFCGSSDLAMTPDGRLCRLAYDLRITQRGIRRWVTCFTTSWHLCAPCRKRFLPRDYLRLEEHFHSLKSWAMYEHVAHRTSLANIAETIRDCYNLPITTNDTFGFKQSLARYYEETCTRLLEKIRRGTLIHADETEVTLIRVGKGYVWVSPA